MFEILNSYLDDKITQINNDAIFQNVQHEISINGYIGHILHFIIKAFQVKKILELGALYGKSAIMMASAGGDIEIDSIENNENNFHIAIENVQAYKMEDRISIHHGDAMEMLNSEKFQQKNFDMIFVDANKLAYLDYLHWCEKFLKKNGIMIFDNVFIHHALEKYKDNNCKMHQKMEEFLDYTGKNNAFKRLILPYERDALCVLIKN